MIAFLVPLLLGLLFYVALPLLSLALGAKQVRGQQLKNKTVSSSTLGQPWPRCRGKVRLNGNMIWSTPIRETRHKSVHGGTFMTGLFQSSLYTYSYSVTCAIAFGKKLGGGELSGGGPGVRFNRIYADGKILYNARVSDAYLNGSVSASAGATGDQSLTISTGGGGSVKLSPGDIITLSTVSPQQLYEVQNLLVLGPGQSGVIGIFPYLIEDFGGGPIYIPGITGPTTDVSSFDPNPHDGSHFNGEYTPGQGGITFYLGDDFQSPDPHIVAQLGTGNVPGYRGMAYITVFDLQLSNYGNRIPNLTAEIDFDDGLTLADVVAGLLTEAGYDPTEYDVSALTATTIQGVEFDQAPYVDSLHELMAIYLFDEATVDGQMIFKFRDGLPQLTVPEDDLGALADTTKNEPRMEETIQDEQTVPETVWIRYYDSLKLFQQASQYHKRILKPFASQVSAGLPITNSRLQLTLNTSITEIGDTMRRQAQKVLFDLWSSRQQAKFKLPPKYLMLDPTDIIEVPYKGDFVLVRITKMDIGAEWAIQIEGIAHDFHHAIALGPPGGIGGPKPPIDVPPNSLLTLLDIPFLKDADSHGVDDTGLYVDVATTLPALNWLDLTTASWHGAGIYKSDDNVTFDLVAHADVAAFAGTATSALADVTLPWVIVPESFSVSWNGYDPLRLQGPSARPATVSAGQIENDHDNLAALIQPGGDVELLQFKDVVDHGDGTFTFTNLVRGVRGTETMAKNHAVGDKFLVLTGSASGGAEHFEMPLGQKGGAVFVRATSDDAPPGSGTSQSLTTIPRDLMPYAPYSIGGYVDHFQNIVITWTRRSRLGGRWADGTMGPLSEQFEQYQVDVYDSGRTTVMRTMTAAQATIPYTKSMQTADFGGPQGSVNVSIYQMSAIVGRGFEGVGSAPAGGPPPRWGNEPYAIVFDMGGGGNTVTADELLLEHVIASDVAGVIFPLNLAGSSGGCRIAPTGDYLVNVSWKGQIVATIDFPAGSTTANFALAAANSAFDFIVESGDLMTFQGVGIDLTISGIYWTVSGRRFGSEPATIGRGITFGQ